MEGPDAEQVIEALPCLASTQRNCIGCGYNPRPGMKWPYGCIKGQSDIVEDAITLLKDMQATITIEVHGKEMANCVERNQGHRRIKVLPGRG